MYHVLILFCITVDSGLQCWTELNLPGCQKHRKWTITGFPRHGWATWGCLSTPRPFTLTWWTDECWTPWAAGTWRGSSASPTSSTRPAFCWQSSCCRCSALIKRSDCEAAELWLLPTIVQTLLNYSRASSCHRYASVAKWVLCFF